MIIYQYDLFSLFLILFSYFIYNFANKLELFKNVSEINVKNKKCHKIFYKNSVGDFIVLDEHSIIASSINIPFLFHKLIYLEDHFLPNDNMLYFNIDTEELKEIQIKNFPKNISFHPHGINLYKNKYIYIINHSFNYIKSYERIEIVEIIKENNNFKELKYLKSIILPENFFGILNSLTIVSNEIIYFTTSKPFHMPNGEKEFHLFHILRYKFGILISTIFNLKLTGMYQYYNDSIKIIEESKGIVNNGIIYDNKKKLIYLSQSIDKQILVFDVKNKIKPNLIKKIKSNYSYDNLIMNKTNGIIYAGITGTVYNYLIATKYYRKYGFWNNFNFYGGFEVIDINNNSKKIHHMSKNLLRSINTGINVNNKQILTSNLEGGLLIC